MSKVIKFKKRKVEVDKNPIYKNAFFNTAKKLVNGEYDHKTMQIKSVYYGVNYINTIKECTYKDSALVLEIINTIKNVMSQLTPNELMQIFPIDKQYDGEKWDTKDYFYTLDELKEIGFDNKIGEHIEDLLWDYQNYNIRKFLLNHLTMISNIQKLQTGKSPVEEWAEEMGIQTYTTVSDGRGGTKIIKTPRKKGSHLKVVK